MLVGHSYGRRIRRAERLHKLILIAGAGAGEFKLNAAYRLTFNLPLLRFIGLFTKSWLHAPLTRLFVPLSSIRTLNYVMKCQHN